MKKRISLVQMNVHAGDPTYNFNHIETLLLQALQGEPDIIVLPETWNTGFHPSPDLPTLSDMNGIKTKAFLSDFARTHHVNIVGGSVAIVENGKVRNRAYVFDRQGKCVGEFTKIHGFSPARENQYFHPGDTVVHFKLDDIPCSMVICYDIRFPELVRMAAFPNTEILFVPAQWPTMRMYHWHVLLAARAIENQLYVCAVNGCGAVGRVQSGGHSLVYDPWGDQQLELDDHESIGTIAIDTDVVHEIRNKINVYNDRRPELYTIPAENA